jgi:hypothetical protein
MQQVITQALRRVEIEVLEVVTREQIAELEELQRSVREAEEALESVRETRHVIDAEYIDRSKRLTVHHDTARERHPDRWRELFD